MSSTLSPNMSLIIPGVGTEPGPTWASDLNSSLGILDQHNHSAGQGVPITPAGMNINADLSINNNNLTLLKTVNFNSQLSFIPGIAPNLGCIYVAGNELYYNDESGNVVQITNVGSVNAGAGSITGLPSGTASASYSAGSQTFIWQSATSTAANMDMGSITLREVSPGANGITISSPGSLAADYSLTLPAALPGSTVFLTLDNSGNIGAGTVSFPLTGANIANGTIDTVNLTDGAVTLPKMAAPNMVVSSSCGAFSSSAATYADVTNFSVNITTTGKPVNITFIPDNSGSGAIIGVNGTQAGFRIVRDSVVIGGPAIIFSTAGGNNFSPPGSLNFIDTNCPAGNHTYVLQAIQIGSNTVYVNYSFMVVREL